MRSMTGFGRGGVLVDGRRITAEIRATNGKALEVKIRGRELDAEADAALGKLLRTQIRRGSLLVTIEEELADHHPRRLVEAHRTLEAVRQELGLPGSVDLATVVAFAQGQGPTRRAGLSWTAVAEPAQQALDAVVAMRVEEGAALARDLCGRVAKLSALAAQIAELAVPLSARATQRLIARLHKLVGEKTLDEGRIAQEAAMLADRLDVSEETVRLDIHLTRLGAWTSSDGALRDGDNERGRRIEFLLQEVGREFNTIGSKTQDAGIASLVIEAKAELEKIREQAQNVE